MKEMKKNNEMTLEQLMIIIKSLKSKGYDLHFEGFGDGNVELVFDNLFVIKKYSMHLNNI